MNEKTAAATQWVGLARSPQTSLLLHVGGGGMVCVAAAVGKRVAGLFLHLLLVLGTHGAHHMGRMTCYVPLSLCSVLGWKFTMQMTTTQRKIE